MSALLHLVASFVGGQGTPLVTVSGDANILDQDTSGTLIAGLRLNLDGTTDELVRSTYTQINPVTDWIDPKEGLVPGQYHAKATITGGTEAVFWDSDDEDTWVVLSTAREWKITRINALGDGTNTVTFTLSISDDGGSTTLDSAAYQLICDNI